MKYFYLFLSIGSLLCFLILLNVLPLYINKNLLREYKNINELKNSLKIQNLPLPSYLPDSINWPPSKILGQSTPYLAIVLVLNSNIKNEPILYVGISESKIFKYPDIICSCNNSKSFTTNINGHPAKLKAGFCDEIINCSEIIIDNGKYQIVLKSKMQLPILLRISESINM